MAFDDQINEFFAPISKAVSDVIFYKVPIQVSGETFDLALILIWLAAASIFLTFYFGFINIRFFKHSIDILRGKGAFNTDKQEGQLNSFQALATSLSGTVGLGNIGGVAVAVSTGGPGAVFWMAMMGLFGMSAKFAEATLGVKYRVHPDKERPDIISGGPMYYIKAAFEKRNMSLIGSVLAAVFAICCIGGAIGAGNMFQANQATQQLINVTGGEGSYFADKSWIIGIILAILVGAVIIGGLKTIAAVASKIVPMMGLLYLVAGLIVIILNIHNLIPSVIIIFQMALTPEAGFGAILGALLIGVQRAAFSNEAGIGSAAIVHATARTNEPVTQGFVGMLGPFIDTIVICMVTALVIVITGVYDGSAGMEGVSLTSRAFESSISWFPYVLAITVFLFAYSTMIAWFYYGLKCLTYLTGEKPAVEMAYKVFFCLCVVVGASSALENIIGFSDAILFAMAIPNVIALYMLAPELKKDLKDYVQKLERK
ncbi:MAG: alanine:cation symporter family protein [Alphaproteobacteria bacterium]|nr:alanine:cation symporter family protein [Alphaproteobacteria bacterium]NCQ87934.1 alanine:cation symporter family protein [Alphaproteobacteria bacterium]NCT05559.1 alanine:cation symporter family protein [Alphaproteobacteria bacterium]